MDAGQDPADVVRQLVAIAESGERAVLRREGRPVAAVVPLKDAELLAELERDDAEAADEGVGQEQATA